MVLKNLLGRKTRSLLTIVGIGIGIAAMVALGAIANGLEEGYTAMLTGRLAEAMFPKSGKRNR